MCVALFDALKHLLLRKTDALITCRKSKFRENVYSGKRLFWHYYLQLSFAYKTVSQISFKLFCREIKSFYQSSLGYEVGFRDIMDVSPNILAKN